jgi:pyridoxamine 5'-phosphate oxidase
MDVDLKHIPPDPFALLARWLEAAERDSGQVNWNTMYLATADAQGRPSVRAVLHKAFDPATGLMTFYTNYNSRKARELEANPRVAAVMHWDRLERQVRIEGVAAPVPAAESDAYFACRPRVSQIGAWASDQSEPLESQQRLRLRVAATALRYAGRAVPRPPHWGGYALTPELLEFWRAMPGRIHRRVVYRRDPASPDGWRGSWVYP